MELTSFGTLSILYENLLAYCKLTASKEEKARKSTLKGLEVLNAWSIYLLLLFLIILTSPLFPGLRTTLENNWVTRISLPINDSTMNYTVSWPVSYTHLLG